MTYGIFYHGRGNAVSLSDMRISRLNVFKDGGAKFTSRRHVDDVGCVEVPFGVVHVAQLFETSQAFDFAVW